MAEFGKLAPFIVGNMTFKKEYWLQQNQVEGQTRQMADLVFRCKYYHCLEELQPARALYFFLMLSLPPPLILCHSLPEQSPYIASGLQLDLLRRFLHIFFIIAIAIMRHLGCYTCVSNGNLWPLARSCWSSELDCIINS